MEKKTGYVVPHTHWDREWRYPLWENRMYLRDLIRELIDTLEREPGYRSFLMDGQTAVLLDYLEICPEDTERVKKLVQDGRIQAGPWFTLPDLYPVSGEALIRNLLKGKEECSKLGGYLKIGYESFGWGQPSQLPQIYRGFGIDTVIISKNVDKTRAPESEFIWKGADGTKVLATRLGRDARANFFMNAYLEIMTGKDYKSEEYEYHYGQEGQFYHRADGKGCIRDYFCLENTESIHKEKVREATYHAWDGMEDSWLKNDRIMMDGTDSTTAQPHLMELLDEINRQCPEMEFKSSSLEEYVDILKEKLPFDKLREICGELRDGPTTSLSGNALMTRPHIKALNKRVQDMLFAQAEPMSAVQYMLGEDYEEKFLKKALDYLLLSHPHDSINGVTQDKTVDDVMYRLGQAEEIADTVYNRSIQNILRRIDYSGYSRDDLILAVFNPTPRTRRETIKICVDTPRDRNIWDFSIIDSSGQKRPVQVCGRQEASAPVVDLHARPYPYYTDRHSLWLDTGDVPAGGYQLYSLSACGTFDRKTKFWAKTRKTRGDEIASGCTRMDNGILSVQVNSDGSITVTDQRSGTVYGPLNYYESTGDVGDYWMYYPPYQNETYTTQGLQSKIYLTENGNLAATIVAETEMQLPAYGHRPENYIRGKSSRSTEQSTVKIKTSYTLKKGSGQVEVKTEIDNRCRDHRMSVVMQTGLRSRQASASGHFTVDRRDAEPLKDGDGFYYNELMTQPLQDFVVVKDSDKGISVVTDSFGEYELRKDGALAFTLFRAVRNIICTEFRSAGEFPDQDGGQMQGKLEYRYAVAPFTEEDTVEKTACIAEGFRIPLKPVQTSVPRRSEGILPSKYSFYEISGDVLLSCCKKAEHGEGIIFRIYNVSDMAQDVSVQFAQKIEKVVLTDLKEDDLKDGETETAAVTLDESGKRLDLTVQSNKINTVRVVFEKMGNERKNKHGETF